MCLAPPNRFGKRLWTEFTIDTITDDPERRRPRRIAGAFYIIINTTEGWTHSVEYATLAQLPAKKAFNPPCAYDHYVNDEAVRGSEGKTMPDYPDGYFYRLTIVNLTMRELVPAGVQIMRGVWYRGGVVGEAPVAVPPYGTAEVMGIRASASNTKGLECRCSWSGGEDEGAVTLSVNIPLMAGGNRAGLDVSGRYRIEGWTGVSRLGHGFSHTLTVRYAL